MKKTTLLVMLLLAVVLYSCSKKGPETAPKAVYKVGVDPIKARIIEQDTFSIPYWLQAGAKGRVLVRLSASDGIAAVSEEQLASIKNAAQAGDYRSLFAMGDARSGDARIFSPANTAYIAHRLGIADEVYWVVPAFESITEADLDGFKQYLKKDVPGQDKEIDAITLVGNVASGKVNGVPVRIMGIKDVPPIGGPVLLDIDNTYFSALYKDEKHTRILGFLSGFFVELKERALSAESVNISASNVDGGVPLKFRFIALYVWTLLNKPDIITGDPPADWSERADAWKVEERSPKEALPIYKNIVKTYPEDSASYYDLSDVYFELGDMENCREALAQAARLDPVYKLGYADYAARLNAKGRKAEAQRFLLALGGK